MMVVLFSTQLPASNAAVPTLDHLVEIYLDWWLSLDASTRLSCVIPLACVRSTLAMDCLAGHPGYIESASAATLLQWQRLPRTPHAFGKSIATAIVLQAQNRLKQPSRDTTGALINTRYDASANRFTRDGMTCDSTASLLEAELLLRAYEISGAESFLHVADRYGEAWADALLDADAVPRQLSSSTTKRKTAETNEAIDEKVITREWIEQGAADLFLALYRHTSTPIYLIAARKLLDIAASDLRSQDCAYAVSAISHYYQDFDDGYFDEYIRIAAARNPLQVADTLELQVQKGMLSVHVQTTGEKIAHPTLQLFYGQLTHRPEAVILAMQLAAGVCATLLTHDALSAGEVTHCLKSSSAGGQGWLEDVIPLVGQMG
jgi:hypothetical protein